MSKSSRKLVELVVIIVGSGLILTSSWACPLILGAESEGAVWFLMCWIIVMEFMSGVVFYFILQAHPKQTCFSAFIWIPSLFFSPFVIYATCFQMEVAESVMVPEEEGIVIHLQTVYQLPHVNSSARFFTFPDGVVMTECKKKWFRGQRASDGIVAPLVSTSWNNTMPIAGWVIYEGYSGFGGWDAKRGQACTIDEDFIPPKAVREEALRGCGLKEAGGGDTIPPMVVLCSFEEMQEWYEFMRKVAMGSGLTASVVWLIGAMGMTFLFFKYRHQLDYAEL